MLFGLECKIYLTTPEGIMTKKEVIAYFGTQSKASRALKITRQAVCLWPDVLPESAQWRVEIVTRGALKSELSKEMEREHLAAIRERSNVHS
jgi:hypothetical protein